MIAPSKLATPGSQSLDDRLCAAIDTHFDPKWGSQFWLRRVQSLRCDPRREIRGVADLSVLEDLAPSDLLGVRWLDFAPRRLHDVMRDLVVVQTGGATGPGAWTCYTEPDFEAAFVAPFIAAADWVGFPRGGVWLYAGPSGPHVIGLAARRLARDFARCPLLSVDLDPRWARKLIAGSLGQQRYLTHVVEQCLPIIREQGTDVLFTTPPIAVALGEALTESDRACISGLHYGGMPLTRETLDRLQLEMFPNAVHLSGYGNTLVGCLLELDCSPGRELCYFPHGDRLHLNLATDSALPDSDAGYVRISRFDEAHLILNLVERDVATLAQTPAGAPAGFGPVGLRDPHTPKTPSAPADGLY